MTNQSTPIDEAGACDGAPHPPVAVPSHLRGLDAELRDRFGPYRPHAWLCLLVALTGRSAHPVSARMVVSAVDVQAEIVTFIAHLLGESRVAYFTRATEAGLLSLQGLIDRGLACLGLHGVPDDPGARAVLYSLVRGSPFRVLNGSPAGRSRERAVRRPVACLIVGGDACTDREVLNRLLTIRFDPMAEAVTHWAGYCLTPAQGVANEHGGDGRFDQSSTISQPAGMDAVVARITEPAHIERVRVALSLASVWRRLAVNGGWGSAGRVLVPEDIELVLRLLRTVRAPADQAMLSRPAFDCLRKLQRLREKRSSSHTERGANYTAGRSDSEDLPGPFTYQGFLQDAGWGSFSVDAVRLWFKELERAGLLEERAKIGRRKSYDLTRTGRDWKPGLLADHLRVLLNPLLGGANAENPTLGLHSPTVGDEAPDQPNADAS